MTKPIEFVAASRRVREILEAYDQSNRLMIDQVYGQLSPTLDDFYEERLTVLFPDAPKMARRTPSRRSRLPGSSRLDRRAWRGTSEACFPFRK